MALRDFPIPGILFFTSGNPFTGSYKGLNYRIDPIKGDVEKDITAHLEVRVWLGEKCSELSDMLATTEFPLDKEGLIAAEAWLRSQYQAYASEI
ncbi:MAG: hypothetical protein IKU51_03615 [Clostridia bacterium]|nr:hypothetical protein [Clostridia bacterium]